MDHLEMVERLRKETGVSYEEARQALEAANWDLLDALISLEKQGKTGAGAHYSTERQAESNPEPERQKKQGETFGDVCKRFWRWFCKLVQKGNRNSLCMERNGEISLTLPVTAFVLLLLLAFWVVLPLMIVALFFGCRFFFRGPELGKDDINSAMGKATDAADNIKREFRSETKAE